MYNKGSKKIVYGQEKYKENRDNSKNRQRSKLIHFFIHDVASDLF